MNSRPYSMAHECPQCGQKDEKGMWRGARLGSSEWGHNFMCCSDECGKALATRVLPLQQTKKGPAELKKLWERLAQQADFRLCGEPYAGYPWI